MNSHAPLTSPYTLRRRIGDRITGKHPLVADSRPCYNRHNHKGEQVPVTVCVAAICDGIIIFGASDRMITSGDIQFEPEQPKLVSISSSIVAQIAGDASIQSEIMQKVFADVGKRIQSAPTEWWNVRDVAELYRHYYEELRLMHAEHDILAPLGLDRNTWFTKQREMDSGLVKNIATELMNYDWPETATIFSGIDMSGAHIYVARNGAISCQDSVGFAVIGVGERHAGSQMMFAKHSRYKLVPETLLLVYSAKKRAEVAPGVGNGTDMFAIGPSPGSYSSISEEILNGLEEIYRKEQESHQEAAKDARLEVEHYVKEIAAKQAPAETQTAKPSDTGGDTSSD